jgi:MarR family transcriptional regulator, transcriptional regulator for hemolysin
VHPLRPPVSPVGLQLGQAARIISRAFDDALAAAGGGSLPVWLILLNLKIRPPDNQRELAEAVGVREATLTHHLNAMDTRGLITRRRDDSNRRIHIVELTAAGEAAFLEMRRAAFDFDKKLRTGIADKDLNTFRKVLGQLSTNVGSTQGSTHDAGPGNNAMPWAGLAEPDRGATGRSE